MADSFSWWWLDRSGIQRVATTEQIREAIEDGRVPASSLVFRAGMASFLPASTIDAFSDIKPPSSYQARSNATDFGPPGIVSSPTAEVSAALRKTRRGEVAGTLLGHAPATAPRPEGKRASVAPPSAKPTSKYPAVVPPPPKLSESHRPSAYPPHGLASCHPIAPSGEPVMPSVPPPPVVPDVQALDASQADEIGDAESQAQSLSRPLSNPPPAEPGLAHFDLDFPEESTLQADVHVPPSRTTPSTEPDSRVIVAAREKDIATPTLARPSLPVAPIRDNGKWVLPTVGVAVVGLVAIIVCNRAKPQKLPLVQQLSASQELSVGLSASVVPERGTSPAAEESSKGPLAEAPPMAVSKLPCQVTQKATRIVSKAARKVPIETGALEDGTLAAAGFSTDDYNAFGVVVETSTLRLKRSSFDKRMTKPVRRVVPIVTGDQIDFAVDVDNPDAIQQDALTIPTSPPINIGWFQDSLTVTSETSPIPAVLWKKPGDKNAEAMRGIAIPSKGTSVTFRLGDSIYLGSMDQKYEPQGALGKIVGTGVKVGAPSIGWNGRELMVAFANQETESEGWKIRYARGNFGKTQNESEAWTIPSGGPEGEAMAPSVLGQPDGRWLFVWTEGKAGKRDVRAQTYDFDMNALGEPMTISPAGANAGQGIIAMTGTSGAIFYLSLVGANYEVWATSISCPRE